MKTSSLFLSVALATLALSGCGDGKESAPAGQSWKAGEAVPPPAGKQWSAVVSTSPAGGFVMGNPQAALKVAEYGSFTCSHCAEFAEKSAGELEKMVDTGKVSFEFRPYVRDPLDMTAAMLAGCSGPEPFFPLSHQLFGYQQAMFEKAQAAGDAAYQQAMSLAPKDRFFALANLGGLVDFVKQRGVSEDKAKACLADEAKAGALAAAVQDANGKYKITGTPTLIINDSVVENVTTWEALRARLTEAGV